MKKIDNDDLIYLEQTARGMHPKDIAPIATAEFNLELYRLARIGLCAVESYESEIRELREKLGVAVEALESLIKYDTSPDYGDSKMAWDMCVNALEKLRGWK